MFGEALNSQIFHTVGMFRPSHLHGTYTVLWVLMCTSEMCC